MLSEAEVTRFIVWLMISARNLQNLEKITCPHISQDWQAS